MAWRSDFEIENPEAAALYLLAEEAKRFADQLYYWREKPAERPQGKQKVLTSALMALSYLDVSEEEMLRIFRLIERNHGKSGEDKGEATQKVG